MLPTPNPTEPRSAPADRVVSAIAQTAFGKRRVISSGRGPVTPCSRPAVPPPAAPTAAPRPGLPDDGTNDDAGDRAERRAADGLARHFAPRPTSSPRSSPARDTPRHPLRRPRPSACGHSDRARGARRNREQALRPTRGRNARGSPGIARRVPQRCPSSRGASPARAASIDRSSSCVAIRLPSRLDRAGVTARFISGPSNRDATGDVTERSSRARLAPAIGPHVCAPLPTEPAGAARVSCDRARWSLHP